VFFADNHAITTMPQEALAGNFLPCWQASSRAVEGGILPPGKKPINCNLIDLRAFNPPGETRRLYVRRDA
jgi:hypothetical protein